jgi:hypothetical protein
MYNMLMTANGGDWNNPTWVLSTDRFLEHTNEAIASRYRSMSDSVVEELKSLPTLFTYEKFVGEPARVGQITEIQRRARELKITLALDPTVPPIQPPVLEKLYNDLDIEPKAEVHRTHWAVKEVDLVRVLKSAGIVTAERLLPQLRIPAIVNSDSTRW